MTVLSPRRGASAGPKRGRPARAVARPGVAVAASAPVALVVFARLGPLHPHGLLPCLLSLIAAGVLVLAAELASFERPVNPPHPGAGGSPPRSLLERGRRPPSPGPSQWADPAMLSVERWLAHWPGVAGVSAVSWWAARVGAAGLLSALAFAALRTVSPAAVAAGAVAALAVLVLLPGSRHLVHLALGAVALAGLLVAGSGAAALWEGRLTTPLLPAGNLLPGAHAGKATLVGGATTVVVLCLAAVCLPAVSPATSRRKGAGTASADAGARGTRGRPTRLAARVATKPAKWAAWGSVGTAIAGWVFAVPALVRAGGFSASSIGSHGPALALTSALAAVLAPLGGRQASAMAVWLLAVTCLAGALGALAGGARLAETAFSAARSARGSRHGATGPGQGGAVPGPRPRSVPVGTFAGIAAASALGAGGVALAGPRQWLVVALGALAAGALALATLAPPVLRQCQRVSAAVRAAVGILWTVTVTVAVGSSGPLALAITAPTALLGAYALGWRGQRPEPGWGSGRLAVPWSTAATALLAASAVTTLEVLHLGSWPEGLGVWSGLAVVVAGAGVAALAVFPATSRLRVEHLGRTASILSVKALPALAQALEAVAGGCDPHLPTTELSELKAATRRLEAELAAYRAPDETLQLTNALLDASRQVLRLASGVGAVARLDRRRLEELVEERTTALSSANRHLVDSQWRRRQLLDRTVQVAESERARIAANLHDGPIQRLAALGLILDRCRLRLERDDPGGAGELVVRARNELSDEIQNLRQMMSELRPPILDQGGLEAAIRDQLSAWSRSTGVEARFDTSAHPVLSPNLETVVYRVVQESLANVAKHARASLTTVGLTQSGNGVQVVVRDNGRGFGVLSQPDLLRRGHFGLVVMRERVELAAGRFEVRSAPSTGTEVAIWLPAAPTSEPVEAA
ncbi:MAG: ATP-binding protein [Acidimicrobiales bacterium]